MGWIEMLNYYKGLLKNTFNTWFHRNFKKKTGSDTCFYFRMPGKSLCAGHTRNIYIYLKIIYVPNMYMMIGSVSQEKIISVKTILSTCLYIKCNAWHKIGRPCLSSHKVQTVWQKSWQRKSLYKNYRWNASKCNSLDFLDRCMLHWSIDWCWIFQVPTLIRHPQSSLRLPAITQMWTSLATSVWTSSKRSGPLSMMWEPSCCQYRVYWEVSQVITRPLVWCQLVWFLVGRG